VDSLLLGISVGCTEIHKQVVHKLQVSGLKDNVREEDGTQVAASSLEQK